MNQGRLQMMPAAVQVLRPHAAGHSSTSASACEHRILKDVATPFNQRTPSCGLVDGRQCWLAGT